MRLLMLSALICVVLLALSCVVVMAVGEHQPLPPRVDILHLTDCAPPCWLGIQPGKTTLEEAEIRLFEVYGKDPTHVVMRVPNELYSYEIMIYDFPQTRLNVTFVGSPVEMITVAPINHPAWGNLSLGDVFAIYGKPSGVVTDNLLYILHGDISNYLMIPVAIRTYGASRPKERLLIDETVSMLAFYHNPQQQSYAHWKRWHGFAVMQPHYLPVVEQ